MDVPCRVLHRAKECSMIIYKVSTRQKFDKCDKILGGGYTLPFLFRRVIFLNSKSKSPQMMLVSSLAQPSDQVTIRLALRQVYGSVV